jgi:hypothetical protein
LGQWENARKRAITWNRPICADYCTNGLYIAAFGSFKFSTDIEAASGNVENIQERQSHNGSAFFLEANGIFLF